MSELRRLAVALFGALVLALCLTATAAAGYQGDGSITCTPSTAEPGTSVTCTATGFEPGAQVVFTYGGSSVGSATADAEGNATLTFTVPGGAASTTVMASGMGANGSPLALTTVLGVTIAEGAATTVAPTSTALPVTGSDTTGDLARIGVVLIAGGGLALLLVKRRHDAALAD